MFNGTAKRIEDIDIGLIARTIKCGEDELHAFMDVEAAGSGFDSKGRPKMLFEPHKFYQLLSNSKRDEAVKKGLAYPRWGEKPYPKDSYPRLAEAMKIDEAAALKSASWGLTQILGTWHRDIGYNTVQEMVQAFADDEENHLKATVTLLKQWGIADDLAAHNWKEVARVWNGPAYAKNQYDIRMANAYKKWAAIKDTQLPPIPVYTPTPKPVVEVTTAPVMAASIPEVQGGFGKFISALMAFFKARRK